MSAESSTGDKPTTTDAMLLLTILNGPAGERASAGAEALWTFPDPPSWEQLVAVHPVGSSGYLDIMGVLTVAERIGTFVKNGVLHTGLALDLVAISMVWQRCARLVADMRIQRSNERLFENFEWLATQGKR